MWGVQGIDGDALWRPYKATMKNLVKKVDIHRQQSWCWKNAKTYNCCPWETWYRDTGNWFKWCKASFWDTLFLHYPPSVRIRLTKSHRTEECENPATHPSGDDHWLILIVIGIRHIYIWKELQPSTTQFLINSLVQNGSNHFPGSSQQVHGFATDVITGSAVVAAASAAKQWHSCLGHLEAFRSSYMQLRVGLSQLWPRSRFNSIWMPVVHTFPRPLVRLILAAGFSCNLHTHSDEPLAALCQDAYGFNSAMTGCARADCWAAGLLTLNAMQLWQIETQVAPWLQYARPKPRGKAWVLWWYQREESTISIQFFRLGKGDFFIHDTEMGVIWRDCFSGRWDKVQLTGTCIGHWKALPRMIR